VKLNGVTFCILAPYRAWVLGHAGTRLLPRSSWGLLGGARQGPPLYTSRACSCFVLARPNPAALWHLAKSFVGGCRPPPRGRGVLGPPGRLQGHAAPLPVVTVTLGIANGHWHGSGRQRRGGGVDSCFFRPGGSRLAKVRERWPRLAGMGIARQTMGGNGVYPAGYCRHSPSRPKEKESNHGIWLLVSHTNPSPDPSEQLLLSSELSQPRVRPHIDGRWLASGMKNVPHRPIVGGANQSDTGRSRTLYAVPDSPVTRGPWLGSNSTPWVRPSCLSGVGGVACLCKLEGPGSLGSRTSCAAFSPSAGTSFECSGPGRKF
jgi:hypothetical protein